MLEFSYQSMVIAISCIWILIRGYQGIKLGQISWKRELELILVYICLIVVARFTFFPFGKVDGKIQPLVFDTARLLPLRINLIPLVNLADYEIRREALLNIIGNTTMFIPIGVIWPLVFRKLDSPLKVIAAGVGFSLCIEILQLPFFDRVSDVDDLLLNSLGFLAGYGLFVAGKAVNHKIRMPR